ncbi:MAG: histidinol-phosphate transaminase [Gammaproteobacteria bacterium]|nr:histidinol-phosphate transaminase [Gammaproteobacteria bacterium]
MPVDVLSLATPGVRGLTPYIPGKPVEELERELGITNAIKLASNENPLGPSLKALAAVQQCLQDIARYPDGGGFALKRALAARYNVAPEQITLGNGSSDVIEFAARIFVAPGDEVVFSQHAFAMYPILTQAIGGRAVEVPARDWGHDLEAMAKAVTTRTKLVFITNPNNPTGTWFGRTELNRFLKQIPSQVIVVLDEAYFEYVDHPEYPDGLTLLNSHPNLVVARTFSKVFGLAGLRVGYSISSAPLADLLNRVRPPFNVNSLAMNAAVAALGDEEHLRKTVAINHDGMRQLTNGFRELALPYIPSVGNFVCVEVGEAARVNDALLRQGVIVRPVANYGMPHHLRVTVGLPEENVRFLGALKTVLTG